MYSFILGFQRLVWCPKWTPASSSSFIVILAKLPPYWIASFAADCPLGIYSLVRSRQSGREDFWPRLPPAQSPHAGPQAAGKIAFAWPTGTKSGVALRKKTLAFRELEPLAGALLSVLLALFSSGI